MMIVGGRIPPDQPIAAVDRTGTWALGRFQLRRELHSGAEGEVWLAREEATRQLVVAKLARGEAGVQRLRRAARALERIRHDHVVRYVADGAHEDGWCLVTEHVEGATLGKVLWVTSPSPPRAVGWMRQLCSALAACHRAGVVHADLDPEHVVMGRDAVGRDKLVLIGFERATVDDDGPDPSVDGFLPTAAPERTSGALDPRADVYAVGALLYRLLCGGWPFGGSDDEVRAAILAKDPPPLGQHLPTLRLPPGLEELVVRCLSKVREARVPTALELGDQLAELEYAPQRDWRRVTGLDLTITPSDRDPPPARPAPLPWAMAAVAGAGLLGAVWWAMTAS